MALFEFLMVLLSIIIGLGLAEILRGIARTIKNRSDTRTYWVHSLTVVLFFFAHLQLWWESWEFHPIEQWDFPGLLMLLSLPVILYLIAHILFPDKSGQTDYYTHYYRQARSIWSLAGIGVVLGELFRPLIFGNKLWQWDSASSLITVPICIALVITEKPWMHATGVSIGFLVVMLDILLVSYELVG